MKLRRLEKDGWSFCLLLLTALLPLLCFLLYSTPVLLQPLLLSSLPKTLEGPTVTNGEVLYDLEKDPVPVSEDIKSSRASRTLSQYCYRYSGLSANNTCCRMVDYIEDDGKNILDCVVRTKTITYSEDSEDSRQGDDIDPAASTKGQEPSLSPPSEGYRRNYTGQHWVLVGDSHMRMAFNQLFRIWAHSRVLFRSSEFAEGNWTEIDQRFIYRYGSKHDPTREVKHMDVPLHLTFEWDNFLTRLPTLLDQWLQQPHLAPTLIVTGGALHFMSNNTKLYHTHGAAAALAVYESALQNLAPKLAAITKHIVVVFKLQDHLPKSPRNVPIQTDSNIDQYNSVAKRVLNCTGIVMWDSTIPLSDAYVHQCQLNPRHTADSTWNCRDFRHVGYIVIKHYINMLMNFVCNPFLAVDNRYCI